MSARVVNLRDFRDPANPLRDVPRGQRVEEGAMIRQPHVRRGPHLPPERPPTRVRWGDLLGLAAMVAIAVVLIWLLPLLASPEAPW